MRTLFACLCWWIWNDRCLRVFQNVLNEPIIVSNRAVLLAEEFWRCGDVSQPLSVSERLGTVVNNCVPPNFGELKINVDGSFRFADIWAGLGVIVRDSNGVVIHGGNWVVKGDFDFRMEAMAFLKACELCLGSGWHNVIAESDNKLLIDILNGILGKSDWRCSTVIENIFTLANSVKDSKFSFAGRNAAYWVAKRAARCMSDRVGVLTSITIGKFVGFGCCWLL